MTFPIEVMRMGEAGIVAHFPGTTVAIFRSPVERDGIRRLRAFRQAASVDEGRRLRSLMVMCPEAFSPDPELRREGAMGGTETLPFVQAEAHVFLGNGLKMRAIRGLVSAVILAVRPAAPLRVFASPRSALEWLDLQRLDDGPPGAPPAPSEIEAWVLAELERGGERER